MIALHHLTRSLRAFFGSTLVVMALAAVGVLLAHDGNGFSPLWLANGVVVAVLLRFPSLERGPILTGAAVGLLITNLTFGIRAIPALGFTTANMFEIGLALILMERFADRTMPVYSPRNLGRFMFLAGGISPAVSSMLGAATMHVMGGTLFYFYDVMLHWFAADALGMLVVGPVILGSCNAEDMALLRTRRLVEGVLILALAALITSIVFSQTRYPALFMILPVLTVAAFRLRFIGAAMSIVVVAAIASFETTAGGGPVAVRILASGERILFLQTFLAVSVMATMPMAAILVERERLVARLADRERQYRLLADHSIDMIARIGLDGKRRYVSPASRAILGYSPEELMAIDPLETVHPEDRARVQQVCRALIREEKIGPVCTYRQRRSDGSYAWLEATYRLVRSDRGKPIEFIASVRDIGRRRDAELESVRAMARLEESHRLLSMAERMAGVGHWRIDAITRDIFWSDEVYRIHGRAPGDTPSLDTAVSLYHPDDHELVWRQIDRAMKEGIGWTMRGRIIRADGAIRQVESSGQPEFTHDGRIVGIVGVFRDVTDEVLAEAELIAARDEARALADAKSAFLATMSHEIRTPMTGVLGMIELLRADPGSADRERFFDNLEQSAALLMTVLDDVLDFSKIESGGLMLEQVDFDLAEVARTTLDLFHHAASSKGLVLTLAAPVGRDLQVRGDPIRMRQVIANLVSNAVKFTPAGKIDLRIALKNDGDVRQVTCHVTDTGIGIAPDAIDHLFDPFVQADASTTRRFGGTGLGLAISRRLVEAMDGTIGVESTLGQGTTFHFQVRLTAPLHRDITPGRAPMTVSQPLSILLAEDNGINRALVEALVQREGHRIDSVQDGQQALDIAGQRRFDLILMDMQMPVMDGLTATRNIREGDGPNAATPIFALSADASPERRRLYQDSGLNEFLTKPVDSSALLKRLRRIIEDRGEPAPSRPPLLNEARLAAMSGTIGEAHVDRLLNLLAAELAVQPDVIAELVEGDRRKEAAAAAHAMKGATLNIGADRLTEIAREIERTSLPDAAYRQLAADLRVAAQATIEAIDARRPVAPAVTVSVAAPSAASASRRAGHARPA